MRWRKLGPIFQPAGDRAWMRSHAANPVAEHRGGDRFRVYFGARDERNRSSIGWVEIELRRPHEVLARAEHRCSAPARSAASTTAARPWAAWSARPAAGAIFTTSAGTSGSTVPGATASAWR